MMEKESVSTETKTQTATIDVFGNVSKEVNVTSSTSTTTYDVNTNNKGETRLTNASTSQSDPSISSINYDNTGTTFQKEVKKAGYENLKQTRDVIVDTVSEIPKKMEEDNYEAVKKL